MSDASEIPTDAEVAGEHDRTRRAILAAMQRMLSGCPIRVDPGSLSVVQLAVEAGIGRHHLYRRDPDLRVRFERLAGEVERIDRPHASRQELDDVRAEVERLESLQRRTRDEALQWRGVAELLQRAVNVLQEDLRAERVRYERLEKRCARLAQEPRNSVIPIRRS